MFSLFQLLKFSFCQKIEVTSVTKQLAFDITVDGKEFSMTVDDEAISGKDFTAKHLNGSLEKNSNGCLKKNALRYKRALNKFLREHYSYKGLSSDLLEIIWSNFRNDNRKLAVFLAHAIHGTWGFTQLEAPIEQDNPYTSRGIVQLLGKSRYLLAGEHYVKNPKDLGVLSQDAVVGSLRAYNTIVEGKECLFTDSLTLLNPVEVQGNNSMLDGNQKLLALRLNVYHSLSNLLETEPNYGSKTYLFERYFPQCEKFKKNFVRYDQNEGSVPDKIALEIISRGIRRN